MHYVVKKGTTNFSVELYIIDNTDGTPELGVVFDTSGIDLNYRREGSALVTVTEATLAALTTAHSDGGFKEIGNGRYRFDLPDAAFATGKQNVTIGGTITGMIVMPVLCQLVDYDPEDSVRLGLTALPNAAAEASGGLYTQGSGSGQIAQDSSGRINTNLVAISSSTSYVSTLNTALADYYSYGYFNANVYAINTSASYVSTMDSFFSDYMSNGYVTANVAYISGSASYVSYLDTICSDYSSGYLNANVAYINGSASYVSYLDTICSDYSSGYLNANVAAISSNTGNVSSFDTACGDYSTYGFNANTNYIESSDATDQIGDAVWDEEVTTGHTTADSAGKKLNDASAAGDPWSTTLGGYGAGTAGYILYTNLDAPVSTVDTVVDGIATTLGTAGAGLMDLGGMSTAMKAEVNTEADVALSDIGLNYLVAADAIVGAYDPVDGSVFTQIVSKSVSPSWGDFSPLYQSLEAVGDVTSALGVTAAGRLKESASQIILGVVDTVVNTHTPTTTVLQADDITEATADHFVDRVIIFTTGVLAGQQAVITGYSLVGGIGQFTVAVMTDAPANDDEFIIV